MGINMECTRARMLWNTSDFFGILWNSPKYGQGTCFVSRNHPAGFSPVHYLKKAGHGVDADHRVHHAGFLYLLHAKSSVLVRANSKENTESQ